MSDEKKYRIWKSRKTGKWWLQNLDGSMWAYASWRSAMTVVDLRTRKRARY